MAGFFLSIMMVVMMVMMVVVTMCTQSNARINAGAVMMMVMTDHNLRGPCRARATGVASSRNGIREPRAARTQDDACPTIAALSPLSPAISPSK